MKLGRFVVDAHVHAQRFARAPRDAGGAGATGGHPALSHAMKYALQPYDNSPRLLHDMQCYGVDACVLLPAFGMTNALNVQLRRAHPGRFVCVARAERTLARAKARAVAWSAEDTARELDELLATGDYVGIGEAMPGDPHLGERRTAVTVHSFLDECGPTMEVARKHKVPVQWHTGLTMGYTTSFCRADAFPETFSPLWVHDLAAEWPDVTIVFNHGGMQGGWWERWYDECLHVAAATDNVHLETGLWWSELYARPLRDPNIGARKLVWGTDWGASLPFAWQPGAKPEVYAVQRRSAAPVTHQVDFWGWSLKQLMRLDVPQDELDLILGGNAARLYGLTPPHTRLFPALD